MMLTRCNHWPDALSEYIERKRRAPFAWGSNDCCLFAADWILMATGCDLAASFRGQYSSALGAMRMLRPFGNAVGIAVSDARLSEVDNTKAQRGDIVSKHTLKGPALGICLGSVSAFVARDGLSFVPTIGQETRCWNF